MRRQLLANVLSSLQKPQQNERGLTTQELTFLLMVMMPGYSETDKLQRLIVQKELVMAFPSLPFPTKTQFETFEYIYAYKMYQQRNSGLPQDLLWHLFRLKLSEKVVKQWLDYIQREFTTWNTRTEAKRPSFRAFSDARANWDAFAKFLMHRMEYKIKVNQDWFYRQLSYLRPRRNEAPIDTLALFDSMKEQIKEILLAVNRSRINMTRKIRALTREQELKVLRAIFLTNNNRKEYGNDGDLNRFFVKELNKMYDREINVRICAADSCRKPARSEFSNDQFSLLYITCSDECQQALKDEGNDPAIIICDQDYSATISNLRRAIHRLNKYILPPSSVDNSIDGKHFERHSLDLRIWNMIEPSVYAKRLEERRRRQSIVQNQSDTTTFEPGSRTKRRRERKKRQKLQPHHQRSSGGHNDNASRRQTRCRYGKRCRNPLKCKWPHTPEEVNAFRANSGQPIKKQLQKQPKKQKGDKGQKEQKQVPFQNIPCRFGVNCTHFQNGNCRYFHPKQKQRDRKEAACFRCGQNGHIARYCPATSAGSKGTNFVPHYNPATSLNHPPVASAMMMTAERPTQRDLQNALNVKQAQIDLHKHECLQLQHQIDSFGNVQPAATNLMMSKGKRVHFASQNPNEVVIDGVTYRATK